MTYKKFKEILSEYFDDKTIENLWKTRPRLLPLGDLDEEELRQTAMAMRAQGFLRNGEKHE